MYTDKHLVEFGNYMLSDLRKERTSELLQNEVTHADLENFKATIIDWEITERHEAIDPPHVWSASAKGTSPDGRNWECACVVMNHGGGEWKIESVSDVEEVI